MQVTYAFSVEAVSECHANDTEAFRILEAARSKSPGRYLLEYYFGLLASRLGREDEATVALERAAQLETRSPDPSFELGKIASKQDWPDAPKAFEHVIELNPQFAPAHYELIQVYVHLALRAESQREAQQTKNLVNAQREEVLRQLRADRKLRIADCSDASLNGCCERTLSRTRMQGLAVVGVSTRDSHPRLDGPYPHFSILIGRLLLVSIG